MFTREELRKYSPDFNLEAKDLSEKVQLKLLKLVYSEDNIPPQRFGYIDAFEEISLMSEYLPNDNKEKILDLSIDNKCSFEELTRILGKEGLLRFKPYLLSNEHYYAIVVKYNRFLVNFRDQCFQLSYYPNGRYDEGRSLERIDNYNDIREEDIRVLYYLAAILEPISHIVNARDLLNESWFYDYIARYADIDSSFVKETINSRIKFNYTGRLLCEDALTVCANKYNDSCEAMCKIDLMRFVGICNDSRVYVDMSVNEKYCKYFSSSNYDNDLLAEYADEYTEDDFNKRVRVGISLSLSLVNYHTTYISMYYHKKLKKCLDIPYLCQNIFVTNFNDIYDIKFNDIMEDDKFYIFNNMNMISDMLL